MFRFVTKRFVRYLTKFQLIILNVYPFQSQQIRNVQIICNHNWIRRSSQSTHLMSSESFCRQRYSASTIRDTVLGDNSRPFCSDIE
ncbi:hypothetical protein DICVIV_06184 [Dictyocaulus viviparus]|uniref:Uncharacterized protein n=1 Tax=Dictyocaulus viviparus TaxID=29172 RepID=A0A0D8XV85_DICVI|nr:hypothetical protein DICVIV_06184 [Dictyocaulus viviparus]